jgi:hypothetical protein
MLKLPIFMADTAELVERTVTIRTATKIEIDQIVFIKASMDSPVLWEIVGKGRAKRLPHAQKPLRLGFSKDRFDY